MVILSSESESDIRNYCFIYRISVCIEEFLLLSRMGDLEK